MSIRIVQYQVTNSLPFAIHLCCCSIRLPADLIHLSRVLSAFDGLLLTFRLLRTAAVQWLEARHNVDCWDLVDASNSAYTTD